MEKESGVGLKISFGEEVEIGRGSLLLVNVLLQVRSRCCALGLSYLGGELSKADVEDIGTGVKKRGTSTPTAIHLKQGGIMAKVNWNKVCSAGVKAAKSKGKEANIAQFKNAFNDTIVYLMDHYKPHEVLIGLFDLKARQHKRKKKKK